MPSLHILAAIRPDAAERYRSLLTSQEDFETQVVTTKADAIARLASPETPADVLVIDIELGSVYEMVRDLRQTYPRLLILLVDEDADISMPGRADDVSTDPFTHDDLIRRINRLIQERQTETLRADALPPIRAVAKELRKAVGQMGKIEAAVQAIHEMDFDLVAFYRIEAGTDALILSATAGASALTSIAPDQQKPTSLIGWVAENGQSRVVSPEDEPNYILIKRGRLGAGVCTPVGNPNRYGVLLAAREAPGAIPQQSVMLLELISAQLAAVLAKDTNL